MPNRTKKLIIIIAIIAIIIAVAVSIVLSLSENQNPMDPARHGSPPRRPQVQTTD